MAGGNIKGITVEIGGDTTKLTKNLKALNSETSGIQKELQKVERLLKLDPKNTELLAQKQELLAKQIDSTKSNLQKLKEAKEKADNDMKNGADVSAEGYRMVQREIAAAEQKLKELEKQTSSFTKAGEKLKDVGDKMTDIGKKGMVVTGAIVGMGALAVQNASDMEESLNKVDVAFQSSAQNVKDWAETTLESYGISKGSALEMASLYGDMGTAMGIPTDKAADMSMALVGLVGDLASFKNVSQEVAQNALKGIFTGEGESLKSLGVIMQDATLQEYALANGYKTKYSEMTQAEKVQLRYNYVMEMTKNAQGDFANTSDGTANSLRILTETLKELSAELGEKLLPIITPIIQKITELLRWFGNLSDAQQKVIVAIAAIVAAIPPLLILCGKLITSVGAITTAFGSAKIAGAGFKTSLSSIGIAAAEIVAPIAIAIGAVGGLIAVTQAHNVEATKIQQAHEKEMEAIDKTTQSQIAEAEQVEILKNKLYKLEDQINSGTLSEQEAKNVKEEFNGIVGELNSMIPGLVNNIGTETNAYAIQREQVDELTQSFYDMAYAKAMANAYQEKINKTAKSMLDIREKLGETQGIKNEAQILPGKNFIESTIDSIRGKWVGEKEASLQKELNSLQNEMDGYISELAKFSSKANVGFKNVASGASNSVKKAASTASNRAKKAASTASQAVETEAEKAKKVFEQQLRDLKFNLNMGYISEKQYYDNLAELRDTFLEEGSSEWQQYTVEIKNYNTKVNDEMKSNYVSTLDKMFNYGAISEKDYYEKIKEFRDSYFSEGTSDWWNYTDKIISYEREAMKEYQDNFNSFIDEQRSKMQSVYDERDAFAKKLSSGNLYDTMKWTENGKTTELYKLKDWNEDIDRLDEFDKKLSAVAERLGSVFADDEKGLKTMMDTIRSDPFGEGGKILGLMTNANDEDLRKFASGWKEYNDRAASIAADSFEGEVVAMKENIIGGIVEEIKAIPEEFRTAGQNSAISFCSGFLENMKIFLANIKESFSVGSGILNPSVFAGAAAGSQSYDYSRNNTISVNLSGGANETETVRAVRRMFNSMLLGGDI